MGEKFSFVECVPKRPPRPAAPQKLPLSAGTPQVETPKGLVSVVISMKCNICRDSVQSLAYDSPVITTKSRVSPLLLPKSATSTPSSGNAVCAPTSGGRSSLDTCG